MFAQRDPYIHSEDRPKVASTYSMASLLQLEQYADSCSQLLIDRFSEFAKSGTVVDFSHWMQCYAMDVVGEITVSMARASQ